MNKNTKIILKIILTFNFFCFIEADYKEDAKYFLQILANEDNDDKEELLIWFDAYISEIAQRLDQVKELSKKSALKELIRKELIKVNLDPIKVDEIFYKMKMIHYDLLPKEFKTFKKFPSLKLMLKYSTINKVKSAAIFIDQQINQYSIIAHNQTLQDFDYTNLDQSFLFSPKLAELQKALEILYFYRALLIKNMKQKIKSKL